MYLHKQCLPHEKAFYWGLLKGAIATRIEGIPVSFDDAYGYLLREVFPSYRESRRKRESR